MKSKTFKNPSYANLDFPMLSSLTMANSLITKYQKNSVLNSTSNIGLHISGILNPMEKWKVMNWTILQGLRTKLNEVKERWVDELLRMLWVYRTTPHILTNKFSFNLAFGIEAMILIKIGLPTIQIERYDESSNSSWLSANLDLLEETQKQAHLRMAM